MPGPLDTAFSTMDRIFQKALTLCLKILVNSPVVSIFLMELYISRYFPLLIPCASGAGPHLQLQGGPD